MPAQSSISPKPLETILGTAGQTNNGMFKAVFGRSAKMPCGCQAEKEMGVNTWAAFAGTSGRLPCHREQQGAVALITQDVGGRLAADPGDRQHRVPGQAGLQAAGGNVGHGA